MPSTALPASNVNPLTLSYVPDWEAALPKHEKQNDTYRTTKRNKMKSS